MNWDTFNKIQQEGIKKTSKKLEKYMALDNGYLMKKKSNKF